MDWINTAIMALFSLMKKQESEITITSADLRLVVNSSLSVNTVVIEDKEYILVNREFLNSFKKKSFVPKLKYLSQKFDCENFSRTFEVCLHMLRQNHALGVATVDRKPGQSGGMHKVNVFVDEDRELYILEPQDATIYKAPEEWKIHSITF